MTVKTSTGLRNAMLDTASFRAAMASFTLKIYSGTEPATADAALSGNTLLVEIKNAGGVLSFEAAAVNGVLDKAAAETWSGVIAASGTAAFYRLVLSGDTEALSTTDKRVQGSVGTIGADLNLSSVALTLSATQNIDYFSMALPTL